MSDKEMEAAVEAAWEEHKRKYPMWHDHGPKPTFRHGFEAAQQKPCVWRKKGEYFIAGCQPDSYILKTKTGKFCPYCGGKIEESE